MIQSPPRRSPNLAAIVVLGFVAGVVADFAMSMVVYYVVRPTSFGEADAISVVISILLGAIVGGVMFLVRPHHYGVTAIAAASAFVAGIIGDDIAAVVYFVLHHLPLHADLFTGYFDNPRASLWIGDLLLIATAAGLTALRVNRVRTREGGGMPQRNRPAPPAGPWGAQTPYGPQAQMPYGPPPGPYGPPPGAYGPPPGPYGPPPGAYGPPPGPYGPPPPGGAPPTGPRP